MKKIYLFLVSFILLLFSNVLIANTYFRNTKILAAGIYYSGDRSILLINFEGHNTTMASCATTKRFAISSSAPHYKEMVSLVMTAYVSGQTSVDVYASDTCNHWGNAQDIRGIKMGPMPW